LACAAYDQLHPLLFRQAAQFDLLYLYRPLDTPAIRRLIAAARARAAPVVFDTDDLIWDQRIVEYCDLERAYSSKDVLRFRAQFRRSEALMREANAFVASTEYLAGLLRTAFGKPAYVNRNAVARAMVARSASLFEQRLQAPAGDEVVIGYFSGWPKAHEPDFAIALPGLLSALDELPRARVRIVGHFDPVQLPERLRTRVEMAPFVPFEQLLAAIAAVDINLAPIVDNPHRRAKSAVKMLEAAVVGVPTVASDLEPYRLIVHGRTGMLATTTASWKQAIVMLARDHARRRAIGQAAREQVLRDETTSARAAAFGALLRSLAARDTPSVRL
jgi:glycosyltransferase involved in cell wall biosynthesis